MKFLILQFALAIILTEGKNNELKSEIEIRKAFLSECEKMNDKNQALCEELMKTKLNFESEVKFKSRITAVFYDPENNKTNTPKPKSDLFNLAMPINTCRNEDCEFCCLSTNRCGTNKQCTNSKYYIKYIHGFFLFLCSILFICLLIKCFQTDSYPDQMNSEKIENNDLNELISMFSIIRNNRKKLIS
jgi:hypothetical protein